MEKDKKGRYTYTQEQKQINRAMKMQEIELNDLQKRSESLKKSIEQNGRDIENTQSELNSLSNRIDELRKKTLAIASDSGIEIPTHLSSPTLHISKSKFNNSPYLADEKISAKDIPSWSKVMEKTDEFVPDDVILEDLLSSSDMQYCIDDVKRINDEFARKTKLNKLDIKFLIVATALQTARWIIIQQLMGDLGQTVDEDSRINNKDADKQKKKDNYEWNKKHEGNPNKKSEYGYPTWKDILFGQYEKDDGTGKSSGNCPYDAQENAPIGFNEGGKGMHRLYTLGHDPILGWIFGTANIMTCTISLTKKFHFATYDVKYPRGRFSDVPTSMIKMFSDVYKSTREDKFRLAAALFAQYAHLKSDIFTSMGLPIPVVEVFSEELAGKLYKEQYDALCLARDIKIVGSQASFSILINMVIGFIHKLFYNKEKDGKSEHYEVRTRKILLYSNAIASSINLAYVGANAYWGNAGEALKKLDLGGLLVTLYRLFSDIRFITKVKEQFINEELDKVTKDALANLDSMFE